MTSTKVAATASEDLTIVDNGLFKAICLHQILDSTNGRNRYYRIVFLAAMGVSFSVQIMQVVVLYFAINDLHRFAFTTTMLSSALLSFYKGYVVVTNADRLRAGLDLARYEFTSCGARDQGTIPRTRAVLSTIVRTFAVLSWVLGIVWALTPVFSMGDYLELPNEDGTVSRYRVTIYNVWWPVVPATVFKAMPVWTVFYAVEVIACLVKVFSWLLFDSYVLTMCFTFNAQFHTVSASCSTIGHLDCFQPLSPYAIGTRNTKSDDKSIMNYYDELINNIKDNQRILKKYDDFFNIIKSAILFQIIGGSYSVITFTLLTSLTYLKGLSIISAPFIRLFIGLLFVILELFIYCYIFNHIETEKTIMNFGLYSSNWTAMDLKYKKTLLLAMNMNSAHRRAMKVTQRSILNLEMFSNVMNMSYSIVSVLLNSRDKK